MEISSIPHIIAVHISFLNGENAVTSSQITEKKTMYIVIFIKDCEDSLTDNVNALSVLPGLAYSLVTVTGTFERFIIAYINAEII